MSKKVGIIIVIVIVILILGGVGFMQLNKPANTNQEAVSAQPSVAKVQTQSPEPLSESSLKSLMAAGKTTTCQMTYPDQQGSGTVYSGDGKFRGDFEIYAGSVEIKSHMIKDETYAYMWTDGTKQGTKFKVDAAQNFSPNPNQKNQMMDLEKKVSLNCSNWTVDPAKFTLPTDVKFSDMSEMMTQIQKNASSGAIKAPKMDASVCNNITDPTAKAACLKALSGN